MDIQVNSDNSLKVSDTFEQYPDELVHEDTTYIYGTTDGKDAIYFRKEWFYS